MQISCWSKGDGFAKASLVLGLEQTITCVLGSRYFVSFGLSVAARGSASFWLAVCMRALLLGIKERHHTALVLLISARDVLVPLDVHLQHEAASEFQLTEQIAIATPKMHLR